MKTTIRYRLGLLTAMLILAVALNTSLAADRADAKSAPYSVSFNKIQNSKKHKVRLFADAGTEKVLCSVNGVQGQYYQVFVFNLNSQLITQMTIRSGETAALNNVSRGNYIFEVLVNDEHIEQGQLTVK